MSYLSNHVKHSLEILGNRVKFTEFDPNLSDTPIELKFGSGNLQESTSSSSLQSAVSKSYILTIFWFEFVLYKVD